MCVQSTETTIYGIDIKLKYTFKTLAPIIMNPNDNCTGVKVTVEAGFSFNCVIRVGSKGATVKVNTTISHKTINYTYSIHK